MPLPTVESLTPGLFEQCDTLLGDTISIMAPGGAFITIKVHAVHRDTRRDFGVSSATVQDALVDLDMALLPGKPDADYRILLPRIPGKVFQPRDVQRDESGLRWEFGLKEVK